ncbi:MAG: hypothetical protein F6J93_03320 [Oscillatoria sp. SIO1A7]|nr:hypothetical protein [Oscillatoria sp. SIO1A7]
MKANEIIRIITEGKMNNRGIKLSTLEGLTGDEIEQKLSGIIKASLDSPNGSLTYLQKKVANFETKYEMSSEEMMSAVASGKLPETEALATWAIDYSLLKDLSAN